MPKIILSLKGLVGLIAACFAAGAKAGPGVFDQAWDYAIALVNTLMRMAGA